MNKYHVVANAIRALTMDAVQKANSGHPGAPMGMAEMGTTLWLNHLKVDPVNPNWHNRDRFVLSNGHASMLHYALLHLTGFDLPLEQLQNFRQWQSKTPGHPEVGETAGVETTTGPLGQGLAMAVGLALAEKQLSARFNQSDLMIVDHYTYCFVGDGCLMEGISHEACSLAGTLGLGKLIVLYDSNQISIDGNVVNWFDEDVQKRFESYNWQVISGVDGHNFDQIDKAIASAKQDLLRPSLIICHTVIGKGAPNLAGSEKSHGAPLGDKEISLTKNQLGLSEKPFAVDDLAYQVADLKAKGRNHYQSWQRLFSKYQELYPEDAKLYQQTFNNKLSDNFDQIFQQALDDAIDQKANIATRKASENAINALVEVVPGFLGGSADLTGSNNTKHQKAQAITKQNPIGDYLHYGVREFAMAAMMNGMMLHGGVRPFGGTFLVFSDYMRNAIRLSALMKLPVVYVLTHDSIGLGEDGPTHQPIEHLSSLRLIPDLAVWRPCDSVETLIAWQQALKDKKPSVLALSRQNLVFQTRDQNQINNIEKGGYVLFDCDNPQITFLATGSEVELAVNSALLLKQQNIAARVVSMPCVEKFLIQSTDYQNEVLPENIPILAIEAGSGWYWRAFTGRKGDVIGLDGFGCSAPASVLFEKFGFTKENVINKTKKILGL